MTQYQYIKNSIDDSIFEDKILRLPDHSWIPFDPANTDYQKYLEWVAAGNTPEPADE